MDSGPTQPIPGPRPGLFITFEGTEGSGKSTHVRLLCDRLRETGRQVRTMREPGGTPVGEEIRQIFKHGAQGQSMRPETELLLVNASRAQLVHDVILPGLNRGEIVVCDRFSDSTLAYQGYGRQLPLPMVREAIRTATGTLTPDLTFLLSVPASVSESRRVARAAREGSARDRMEEADAAFFDRVEAGFRALAAADPGRIRVLDSTQEQRFVRELIWDTVAPRLGRLT